MAVLAGTFIAVPILLGLLLRRVVRVLDFLDTEKEVSDSG